MITRKKVKQSVSILWNSIKKQKIRVMVGLVISVLLCVFSFLLLKECNLKTYIVCFGMAVATGMLVAVPRLELPKKPAILLAIVLLIIYGFFVPRRMFERTELVVSDLTPLIPGTIFLNVCILYIAFFILLFLFQRISIALGVEGILALSLTLMNYFTTMFRGTGLSFADFSAAGTAMMVMGNYRYEISTECWKTIIYFVFFIALGLRIDIPLKGWKYHIGITVFSVIGLCFSVYCYQSSDVWNTIEIRGEKGNVLGGEKIYGLYYHLALTSKVTGMEKGKNYSDKELTRLADRAEKEYEPTGGYVATEENPNIILIMNEAWSDLGVLGELETAQPMMPYFDTISKSSHAISGNTYVNIIGGITCNSEFEALTGDSMNFLHTAAIPYNMQVNHSMSSVAVILKERGYHTVAMHPNASSAWDRGKVYDYLGFDQKVFLGDFMVPVDYVSGYPSDDCNMEELIYLYENRDTSKPWFAFNVTIQNHSPYIGRTEITNYIKTIQGQCIQETSREDNYLSLLRLSDMALEKLITYFENVDEPTIICMFGDHQPILTDSVYDAFYDSRNLTFQEQKTLEYRTPYLIWTNYDTEIPEYGDISAAHISPILCELAGVDLPSYYKFILNSRKSIPYFHVFSDFTDEQESLLEDYRNLQYNQLMIKNYRKDIFE